MSQLRGKESKPKKNSSPAFSSKTPKYMLEHSNSSPKGLYQISYIISHNVGCCFVFVKLGFVDDPSAGSPTETLLRLLLPLNDQV